MADRVLPLVHLFFPCESASLDLADEKWLLKQPLQLVELPVGLSFPFRVKELWLYAQMMYGAGDFNLKVQFVERESGTVLGTSGIIQRSFDASNRSHPTEEAFRLRNAVFPKAGTYDFQLLGNHQILPNGVTTLRVLG